MRHTTRCEMQHFAYHKAKAEFDAKYPKHCRKCGGAGYHVELFSPAPGPGYMTDAYPCPGCEDEGACGLCGADLAPDCQRVCGCDPNIVCPLEPECYCWEVADFFFELYIPPMVELLEELDS